jgi:hypothetical protein
MRSVDRVTDDVEPILEAQAPPPSWTEFVEDVAPLAPSSEVTASPVDITPEPMPSVERFTDDLQQMLDAQVPPPPPWTESAPVINLPTEPERSEPVVSPWEGVEIVPAASAPIAEPVVPWSEATPTAPFEADARSEGMLAEGMVAEPSAPPLPQTAPHTEPAPRQIGLVLSPIHSFPHLLEIERRVRSLSSVRSLQLRDFRNGIATFAVGVGETITPGEFGAVVQMLESLKLHLERASESSVELRVEDTPSS